MQIDLEFILGISMESGNFYVIRGDRMKQVKYCMSEKKANEWLKDNQDKKIVDILFSAGGFAIVYEQ